MSNSTDDDAWYNYGRKPEDKRHTPRNKDGTFAAVHNTVTGLPEGPKPAEQSADDKAYAEMWDPNTQKHRVTYPQGKKPTPQQTDRILKSWEN